MAAERVNPPEMYDSVGYGFSHAARSEGTRMLHLAGQVAWDADCNVVGDDIVGQARQALANLTTVLAAEGATPADLVRIRTYVVNHTPENLELLAPAMAEFYGDALPAPNTFIGVAALALPDFLIEIEATAVLP
mgnify:CR=1 FL=1